MTRPASGSEPASCDIASTSPPAQNARPTASKSTAPMSSRSAISWAYRCQSAIASGSTAFSRAGRLRVRWASPSVTSNRIASSLMVGESSSACRAGRSEVAESRHRRSSRAACADEHVEHGAHGESLGDVGPHEGDDLACGRHAAQRLEHDRLGHGARREAGHERDAESGVDERLDDAHVAEALADRCATTCLLLDGVQDALEREPVRDAEPGLVDEVGRPSGASCPRGGGRREGRCRAVR